MRFSETNSFLFFFRFLYLKWTVHINQHEYNVQHVNVPDLAIQANFHLQSLVRPEPESRGMIDLYAGLTAAALLAILLNLLIKEKNESSEL